MTPSPKRSNIRNPDRRKNENDIQIQTIPGKLRGLQEPSMAASLSTGDRLR